MATDTLVTSRRGPEAQRQVVKELSEIPDDQLACRAGRHDWPSDKLQARKPLPKGVRTERQPDNPHLWVMEDVCTRCEKTRYSMWSTLAGRYELMQNWRYIDPKNWLRLARELDVSKHDLRIENMGRCAETLFR